MNCIEFCSANRLIALGHQFGLLGPFFYQICPSTENWYLTGFGYGSVWIAPNGPLTASGITMVDYVGNPNVGSQWESLVSPENDPTREIVWTEPYLFTVAYSGSWF